ncbi:5'-nucleotidase [Streptomyces castrisilvae]|uniref:5'-nucleotidase n=1 Tax=Streptomyces castrisilvae TaxID=3033811 RepID=A0ABY9HKA3_9ACTN|nr:5'-nucleotidase [Streptomyces sp. Mut1]WLQ34736.1 5'-nucleotidase [Streptomyces sp. Mut1]
MYKRMLRSALAASFVAALGIGLLGGSGFGQGGDGAVAAGDIGWTAPPAKSDIGWTASPAGSDIGWTVSPAGSDIGWTVSPTGSDIGWTTAPAGSTAVA